MPEAVAIVLGGTRGIGRALTKCLALRLGAKARVYFSARQISDGARVQADLLAEGAQAQPMLFDLADPGSPDLVAQEIARRHGGIDFVILNGAYMPRAGKPALEDARPMIAANSHGTLRVLRAFLPVLRPHGRIVVVASSLGILARLPGKLRGRFNTNDADPDRINRVMDDYVTAVENGTAGEEGWPEWVNIPSKVGQVAVTRAFARQVKTNGLLPAGALINISNPGLTLTDATRDFMGSVFKAEEAQSPDAAAEHLADLALIPAGAATPYGELVEESRVIPFGD